MGKGYTIVEILVVISIIVVLSAVILPAYRVFGSRFSLERSGHKLAQDIRRAGEMAMSAKEFSGTVPSGYGIYIDLAQGDAVYVLYADKGDEKYGSDDSVVETIRLEEGVKIQSVFPPGSLSVNFKPPSPTIKIFGNSQWNTTAIIVLCLVDDPLKTKTITVNTAGLIEID